MNRTTARASLALAAGVVTLALTGCTPPADDATTTPTPAPTTQIAIPSTPPERSMQSLASGAGDEAHVQVFDEGTFTSTKDCRCALQDAELGVDVPDLFPRGTTVWLIRVAVRQSWTGSLDLAGTTVAGKFADRPEEAVLDTQEGPEKASSLGMPWGPDGLLEQLGDRSTITGESWQSFLLAYHVPVGSTELDLSVDVPAASVATDLKVSVPAAVQQAALDTEGSTP